MWVVGVSRLGRLAAISTTNRLSTTIVPRAIVPPSTRVSASASSPESLPRSPVGRSAVVTAPRGRVVASLDMCSRATISGLYKPRTRRSGPSQSGLCPGELDRLDVYGLGALLALLRVIGAL